MIRTLFLTIPALLLAACSTTDQSRHAGSPPPDSVRAEQPPAPPGDVHPPPPPAATKENLTLIGAIVESIEIIDSMRYKATIELRTAIPAGGSESIAEPGQRITVVPAYAMDAQGKPDAAMDRNGRLMDARSLKHGDFLMGKISLGRDGQWHLIDTRIE